MKNGKGRKINKKVFRHFEMRRKIIVPTLTFSFIAIAIDRNHGSIFLDGSGFLHKLFAVFFFGFVQFLSRKMSILE